MDGAKQRKQMIWWLETKDHVIGTTGARFQECKPPLRVAFSSSLLSSFLLSPEPKGSFIGNKCGCRRIQGSREANPSPTITMENQARTKIGTNPGSDHGEKLDENSSWSNPSPDSPSPLFNFFFLFVCSALIVGSQRHAQLRNRKGLPGSFFFFYISFSFFSLFFPFSV